MASTLGPYLILSTSLCTCRAQHFTTHFSERLARVPVELIIDIERIEGKLMLWIGPPPSDRCVSSVVQYSPNAFFNYVILDHWAMLPL